jgi:hypothetical protein
MTVRNQIDMRGKDAFSVMDLKMVLIVCFLIFFVVGIQFTSREPRGRRNQCMNNLSAIGLAFQLYQADNNGRFPTASLLGRRTAISFTRISDTFPCLGDMLSSPKVLTCPDDAPRQAADSFANLVSDNVSYFISLTASADVPNAFLAGDRRMEVRGRAASRVIALTTNAAPSWSKPIHYNAGYILLSGGSVQVSDDARLARLISEQGIFTNFLVFP